VLVPLLGAHVPSQSELTALEEAVDGAERAASLPQPSAAASP
jgi:hypothetical protein